MAKKKVVKKKSVKKQVTVKKSVTKHGQAASEKPSSKAAKSKAAKSDDPFVQDLDNMLQDRLDQLELAPDARAKVESWWDRAITSPDARPMPVKLAQPTGLREACEVFYKKAKTVKWSDFKKLKEFSAVLEIAFKAPMISALWLMGESIYWNEVYVSNGCEIKGNDTWPALPVAFLGKLLRKPLDFQPEQMDQLLELLRFAAPAQCEDLPWNTLARQVESYAAERPLTKAQQELLRETAEKLFGRNTSQARGRLKVLATPTQSGDVEKPPLADLPGMIDDHPMPWVRFLRESIAANCGGDEETDLDRWWKWKQLLDHAAVANSTQPTKKWLTTMTAQIEELGAADCARIIGGTLQKVGKPVPEEWTDDPGMRVRFTIPDLRHTDFLRGLAWMAIVCHEEKLITGVGECAATCYEKLKDIGPRCAKVGTACVIALGQASTPLAIAYLSRLHDTVKNKSTKAQVKKALDAAAKSAGLTREDIEELNIPDVGLN